MNTVPLTLRQECAVAINNVQLALTDAADSAQSHIQAFEDAQSDGERSYVLNMVIQRVCSELMPALQVEHLATLQAKLVAVRK